MPNIKQIAINELLKSTEDMTGLSVCYHDYLMLSGLPAEMREHHHAKCKKFKSGISGKTCQNFCGAGGAVDKKIKQTPNGWFHHCPHGIAKLAVPVFSGSELAGVLFATNDSDAINDFRPILLAIATRISTLLIGEAGSGGDTRKSIIQKFIDDSIEEPVQVCDLAKVLSLSESRTGHVVKDEFGTTFNKLIKDARVSRAAVWLASSEMTLSNIALRLCFYDQSHFTRAFCKHFGSTPSNYRKQSRCAY